VEDHVGLRPVQAAQETIGINSKALKLTAIRSNLMTHPAEKIIKVMHLLGIALLR
jgi:hypothetical protein